MASEKKSPQRMCVACRTSRNQGELIRYVVTPAGELLVDYRQRLPGRGAYTCIDKNCLKQAVERKAFQRNLSTASTGIDYHDLLEQVTQALTQRILNLVGMARKSGQVVSGSNAVLVSLRKQGDIALVLISKDISASIAEKIRLLSDRQAVPVCQMFNKDVLGRVLGKGERSTVAVTDGTLADALMIELQRYAQMAREN